MLDVKGCELVGSYERWMKVKGESGAARFGCSGNQNHTHGVGVTGARTPASQDDDNISLFEEATDFTHIHGKVDAHVHVLCPHVVGRLGVEHREDAAVQVSLAGCLGITGHGKDGGTRPVPGDQVGGPARAQIHKVEHKRFIFTFRIFCWNSYVRCGQKLFSLGFQSCRCTELENQPEV